ncbi:hypothetical protein ACFE04_018518 [Oxalis oulophora]
MALVSLSMATLQDDEQQCADQLTSLASCIPYVSGSAKKPTPECCTDTKKVKSDSPKCLCVLIKESTDPSMGLPINTTLALELPTLCNMDASVANCPTLLKLAPGSADAKIFEDASGSASTSTTTSSTTDSPTSSSSPASTSTPTSTSTSGSASKSTSSTSNGNTKLGESSALLVMAIGNDSLTTTTTTTSPLSPPPQPKPQIEANI